MDRPIPAFYCVYLLRSKRSPGSSLYIGSTPNPRRRLRQHNGNTKGGARRTHYSSKRPWKMCTIVTGFPSKIAALQFEWAWQHPYITRHIDRTEIPADLINKKYSNKRLQPCIRQLHMLLRHRTFARWPLQVSFFSYDAHQHWQNYLTQTAASLPGHMCTKLMSNDAVAAPRSRMVKGDKKPPQEPGQSIEEDEAQPSIDALQISYDPIKDQVQVALDASKSQGLLCHCCEKPLDGHSDHILFCPECHSMASHLTCLSSVFLHEEKNNAILPTSGRCPQCDSVLTWSDLVKNLSIRIRGQSRLQKLLSKPRTRKRDNGEKALDEPTSNSNIRDSVEPSEQSQSDQDDFADIEYVDPEAERSRRRSPKRRKARKSLQQSDQSEENPCSKAVTNSSHLSRQKAPSLTVANSDTDDVEAFSV